MSILLACDLKSYLLLKLKIASDDNSRGFQLHVLLLFKVLPLIITVSLEDNSILALIGIHSSLSFHRLQLPTVHFWKQSIFRTSLSLETVYF